MYYCSYWNPNSKWIIIFCCGWSNNLIIVITELFFLEYQDIFDSAFLLEIYCLLSLQTSSKRFYSSSTHKDQAEGRTPKWSNKEGLEHFVQMWSTALPLIFTFDVFTILWYIYFSKYFFCYCSNNYAFNKKSYSFHLMWRHLIYLIYVHQNYTLR